MRALALICFAAALGGCAASGPAEPSVPAPTAGETSDLEALYWQRQEAARQRFTEADVAFMTGMIGHHAQALVMSRMAPTHGASRSVRTLAARIINAQRDEIETMQRWLRDRDQPVPVVTEAGATRMPPGVADPHAGHAMATPPPDATHPVDASGRHPGEGGHSDATHARHVADGTAERHRADGTHDAHHGADDAAAMDHAAMGHAMPDGMTPMDHAGMPGMLSTAQLAELDAARGTDFDRLFLRYMIQHHGGAIVMVDDLIVQDGAVQDEAAFKLAADVRVDQATEIARMQQMLDALDSSP